MCNHEIAIHATEAGFTRPIYSLYLGFFPSIHVKWKRAIHWCSNLLWYWWIQFGCCTKINLGQYVILYPLWHNHTRSYQCYVKKCHTTARHNICRYCIMLHCSIPHMMHSLVNFSRVAAIKYKPSIGNHYYIETWGSASLKH